jgi:hypothetical protein
MQSLGNGFWEQRDLCRIGIVEAAIDMQRDRLSYAGLRPVVMGDHASAAVREEWVRLTRAGPGRKLDLDWHRSIVLIQVKEGAEVGVVVAGKSQEANEDITVGIGTETTRLCHILVRLPGKVLLPVVRKDKFDMPGRFARYLGGWI